MKVTEFTPRDAMNINHRKEDNLGYEYALIDLGERRAVLILRLYYTKTRAYACVWVHGENHASGSAFAGGCGYDKGSAAAEKALEAAGFTFDTPFGGRGLDRIQFHALPAIAEYLGITDYIIHRAGG